MAVLDTLIIMRKIVLLFITLTALVLRPFYSAAQDSKPPKLVVHVIVSQMRYDYLKRFGHNFSDKGFRLFMNDGVLCTNARYDYMNNTTPAGIATVTSGANPSSHGIISDRWIDYTTNSPVNVVTDTKYFGVGSVETDGQFAPTKLTVSTIGDELKRHNKHSKVISLALDPTSAVLAGGTTADAAYWFDIHRGNWSTSTYYQERLPNWVEGYNEQRGVDAYNAREWTLSKAPSGYVYSERSEVQSEEQKKSWVFSLTKLFRKNNAMDDYGRLRLTPIGTDMLTDFAKRTVVYENLGKDDDPDLLFITVDPTRCISETYGTESMEVEDAYYRLDENLADLMEYVGVQVGKENVLFILTADHGSSDTYRAGNRMPSGLFNVMQFKVLMNGFLNTQYGTENWVIDFANRSLYLNHRIVYEKGLNLDEMQTKAAAFALQFRGVAQAITATSLQHNHFSGGALEKVQNGFYPKHSGDIVLNLMPGWIEEEEGKVSMSGSMYEYDTHVPLMWYGSKLGKNIIHTPVNMTDIAPTLARILDISQPDATTGQDIIPITSKFTE